MALVNCKECNEKISSKAEKCPKCGIKLKSGGCGCFTYVFLGILTVIIIFIYNLDGDYNTIIDDERTYSESWRSPRGSEYREIGKIIVQNGIEVCGEYYVKDIELNEYVIACTADGTNWNYYVVYTSMETIYRANDEMESKLFPPR